MFDVIALGEVLIDFTPAGRSAAGAQLFEQNPGGAPANVLTALTKLGHSTALIGSVGDDIHGAFLRETLEAVGISTRHLRVDADAFTTLAFVQLSDEGERSFSFARKPGADTRISPAELPNEAIASSRIFHFGSLSLTHEPARSATLQALRLAQEAGLIRSYDPNYRAPLWNSRDEAIAQMRAVLPQVDVMKLSDEECLLLTGLAAPEQAAKALLALGIGCVVVTLGADGALALSQHGCAQVDAFHVPVADTTGAGDAFWGGFLHCLLEGKQPPAALTDAQLQDYLRFANATAACCVQKRGAIPAMPQAEDIAAMLTR